MPVGLRKVFAELGTPADTLDCRFVNGFMYTRLRPLIAADRPAKNLPPRFVLKAVGRFHPEFRRRAKGGRARQDRTAVAQGDRRLGARRPGVDRVAQPRHPEGRPHRARRPDADRTRARSHRALPHQLGASPLVARLRPRADRLLPRGLPRVGRRADAMRFHCWRERRHRPSVRCTSSLSYALRSRTAHGSQTLDDVRAISPEAAGHLNRYLEYRGSMMISRYDIDGVTLAEIPDVVLATILNGVERSVGDGLQHRIEVIRARVPVAHQEDFDSRLEEARAAMDLRDDNGPTTAEWPLGLVRLAMLEVGRRMVVNGCARQPSDGLELELSEITLATLTGHGPGADELERRTRASTSSRCTRRSAEPRRSRARTPVGTAAEGAGRSRPHGADRHRATGHGWRAFDGWFAGCRDRGSNRPRAAPAAPIRPNRPSIG